jgi:hypothetical protein
LINEMPDVAAIPLFLAVLLAPLVISVLILLVPSRRREEGGVQLGNPLSDAPLAEQSMLVTPPLVQLCRMLNGRELENYVLGLRHLPVESAAPLLQRLIQGVDPALQLYAQGVRQQGLDRLQAAFLELSQSDPNDPRRAAWLLETGLRLAHPALSTPTERELQLARLAHEATARLAAGPTSPALVAAAAEVYLEAGRPGEAAALVPKLEAGSALRARLYARCTHALHQLRNSHPAAA